GGAGCGDAARPLRDPRRRAPLPTRALREPRGLVEPKQGAAHHRTCRARVVLSGCLRDQPGGRGEDLLEPAGQIDANTGVVWPREVLELTAERIEPARGHVRAYTSHAGVDGAGNTVVARQH